METGRDRIESAPLGVLLEEAGVSPAMLTPDQWNWPIAGLEYHSGRVAPGFLFFAFSGAKADGRRFAVDALSKGAAGVVSELPAPEGFVGLWIMAPQARRVLALMARRLYRRVRESVSMTGITGTNGKTTTCSVIDAVLRAAGFVTAQVGTIEYRIAGEKRSAVNTTPESLDLYRLYDELVQRGGTHAVMEVSSHALALGRVWGVAFHTAVFTNLTRDHLDFHSDMDDYFHAKCELFRGQDAPPPRWAILNGDDEWSRRIPVARDSRVIRYGLSENCDLRARDIEAGFDGLRFTVEWQNARFPVRSGLAGQINVYNTLAAFGAGLSHGIAPETIAAGIESCPTVAGRFERVQQGQPFLVVVDYAHTDDALRRTIGVARSLAKRRVITLFGCGGDRDRAKRPLMGQAAGELSDFVVLTSDNPRTEDPLAILNDALVGLRRTDVAHVIEPDREKAIRAAIHEATEGDVVLIAGKGHENYQVLRDKTIHFDDREVARAVLAELGFREGTR